MSTVAAVTAVITLRIFDFPCRAFGCRSLLQNSSSERELSCDVAEEVAFGRWLRNEAVTVEELHEHCGKEIAERVAGRHVLAIQDTTEVGRFRRPGTGLEKKNFAESLRICRRFSRSPHERRNSG